MRTKADDYPHTFLERNVGFPILYMPAYKGEGTLSCKVGGDDDINHEGFVGPAGRV